MRLFVAFLLAAFILPVTSFGQYVSLDPTSASGDDQVTLYFNASEGNAELEGVESVYVHHGVVTDSPNGTDWQYVKGNWGKDDGIGKMTKVEGENNLWKIDLQPSIRSYFDVPENENIFRLSCVFRSADGSAKGTSAAGQYGWGTIENNLDVYIDLNIQNYITLENPLGTESYLNEGESLNIRASASDEVSEMSISIDEGNGFVLKSMISSGSSIDYNYSTNESLTITIKIEAVINGEPLEIVRDHNIIIKKSPSVLALPDNVVAGINYHEDATKATLVLEAPEKQFVHVVGDFNNWIVNDDYLMNITPDGRYHWLELSQLEQGLEYVFQYWVDGEIKIADPYADKIADPWNDQYIEESVYPNLLEYDRTEFGIASILQTGQEEFIWDAIEDSWQRPDIDNLVIYELHIRDFIEDHSYTTLIDTLDYLKNLGVEAIELMPVSEFEGNDSWGYNPSFYFAPDKYYGTKDHLKMFIQEAHKKGMAVILDIVLNHAFGQNPMVQLYFDKSSGKPESNNPWFNREYIGPFEWGYDFNHESEYTKEFIDRVNTYWIEEFHFDGFRFDFTKGMTNYAPNGNIDGFDQSRIDILKRMSDVIWDVDPETYIILEHWGPYQEEQVLAAHGCKMWRNKSYDFVPATIGSNGANFDGIFDQSHVSFFDSHDERRIAEHCLTEGVAQGDLDIKREELMYERVKMAAAFNLLAPGPKMIWQFDELGYDIDINFNGRTGRKPYPWGANGLGYYEDELRQNIYKTYQGVLDVRKQIGAESLYQSNANHKLTGWAKRYSYDTDNIDMVLIGNFALSNQNLNPEFSQTGTWYDYFSGEEILVDNVKEPLSLKPGEWHIFTSERLSDGIPGVVEIYSNPVNISPSSFTIHDDITIVFDARKAFPDGTDGLVGVDKVYMHAGLVVNDPNSKELSYEVGNLIDDGVGEMSYIVDDKWQIKLKISDYFNVDESNDVFRIGMYFRDKDNVNLGKGFRNDLIYFDIRSLDPMISISPAGFESEEEIVIRLDAKQGNGELIGANKVYLHCGVGTIDTSNPESSAWSNVVGNWGQDDGVGRMTKVSGETDVWEIVLTPKTYFGLQDGDHPYWLAAVFRNEDGSKKGTTAPGPILNGFVADNLDFFIQNQRSLNIEAPVLSDVTIFPNPTSGNITVDGIDGNFDLIIYDIYGNRIKSYLNIEEGIIDLETIPSGIYSYRIVYQTDIFTGLLILNH